MHGGDLSYCRSGEARTMGCHRKDNLVICAVVALVCKEVGLALSRVIPRSGVPAQKMSRGNAESSPDNHLLEEKSHAFGFSELDFHRERR